MDMSTLTEVVIIGCIVMVGATMYMSKKLDNLTIAVLYWQSRCKHFENQASNNTSCATNPSK